MSYDLSDIESFRWTDSTFGATGVTHVIQGPRGKWGFVRDLMADITTSLVGTTTVPEIVVGISSGDATFGRYRLGTAITTGYNTGMHRASQELITGNPPRVDTSFASKVILDGGPLTSEGVAGGSYDTAVPAGRIPASPFSVINVISGTAGVARLYTKEPIPIQLVTGQLVTVVGVGGATGTNTTVPTAISALSRTANYIELSGTSFGGTYTSGGQITVNVIVTALAGVGGSPAGGGHVTVKFQWCGPQTP